MGGRDAAFAHRETVVLTPLAILAACVVTLSGVLYGASRGRVAAAATRELERVRTELDGVHARATKRGESERRRDEEVAELRRRLEKTKRRASQMRGDERQESARIRELEEKARLAQADARAMRAALERAQAEAERLRAAPRPPPAPVPAPSPAREPAPAPDEALVRRAETAEARALTLEEQLVTARVDAERQRRKVAAQDRLYVALRGELDAKKERLRTQQEELERLRALRVVLAGDPAPQAGAQTPEAPRGEAAP